MLTVLTAGLLVLLGMTSCSRSGQTSEEARVKVAFTAWKSAMLSSQTDQAMTYIPGEVDAYFGQLNSGVKPSTSGVAAGPSTVDFPVVDLLLRTALEKKVPAELRPNLTLNLLMRRIADKQLINLKDIEGIDLGRITINGHRASAELYYEGALLPALRLPFVQEGETWKIDVMAILPDAEILMRVDRAITGESADRQVDQLVKKLPPL